MSELHDATELTYAYSGVPRFVAEAVTTEVKRLAEEEPGREYDAWTHELPAWVVAQRMNHRSNYARVEAVWSPDILQPFLSFSSDAHEDKVELRNGSRQLLRRIPSAEQVSRTVRLEPFLELRDSDSAHKIIRQHLIEVLSEAGKLVLDECRLIEQGVTLE
ncbi:MAG: hypothetical protein EPO22_05705 [Dehalococcoidia bacterium]|nr:MAG: hypothetical protein EPO22_05705 [Dehalococcoidia bacterium]